MHLHCSIVGTCLPDAELRKVLREFVDVTGASELDVHHDAVRLAGTDAAASRALHKTLDRRYDAVLRRFSKAKDASEVERLWKDFMRRGEVPGAYWAVLSHRYTTEALRQQVFGEVHMLSHLMGASTRADLRQRVVLDAENADLRAQNARLLERCQRLVETHDRAAHDHQQTEAALAATRQQLKAAFAVNAGAEHAGATESDTNRVARQTQRRERAESQAAKLMQANSALRTEIEEMRTRLQRVVEEIRAAEEHLQRYFGHDDETPMSPSMQIGGRRLLYVGGRPSTSVAIREMVERHGGEIRRHDGGLEDRKGQLAASIAWADTVLFPVDCIDHDSAINLKRQCLRLGIPFVPLRTASVASFVAAMSAGIATPQMQKLSQLCLRHG